MYNTSNICLIITLVITFRSQRNENWLLRNNTINSVVRFILIGNESYRGGRGAARLVYVRLDGA